MMAARVLAALAVRIAPADRKTWAEALGAELEHVERADTISFAAGGVLLAVRLRLADPGFVLGASRYGLAAGALVWAALHLRLASRLDGIDPSLSALPTYVAAGVFGVGGVVTALAGLRFTCLLGLPTLAAAATYTVAAGLLTGQSPNSALYQALAVEDLLSLALAVGIAAAARRYANRRAGPA